MKTIPIIVNACAQDILILTCAEHTSITSPVDETQTYDCEHQDKGTDQIWNFRDVRLGEDLRAKKLRNVYDVYTCTS